MDWNSQFFFIQIDTFLGDFSELKEHEPTQEEVLAGIDRFERFGIFATVLELARKGGLGSTADEVLIQPSRVVYNALLYDYYKSQFEREYTRISNELNNKA